MKALSKSSAVDGGGAPLGGGGSSTGQQASFSSTSAGGDSAGRDVDVEGEEDESCSEDEELMTTSGRRTGAGGARATAGGSTRPGPRKARGGAGHKHGSAAARENKHAERHVKKVSIPTKHTGSSAAAMPSWDFGGRDVALQAACVTEGAASSSSSERPQRQSGGVAAPGSAGSRLDVASGIFSGAADLGSSGDGGSGSSGDLFRLPATTSAAGKGHHPSAAARPLDVVESSRGRRTLQQPAQQQPSQQRCNPLNLPGSGTRNLGSSGPPGGSSSGSSGGSGGGTTGSGFAAETGIIGPRGAEMLSSSNDGSALLGFGGITASTGAQHGGVAAGRQSPNVSWISGFGGSSGSSDSSGGSSAPGTTKVQPAGAAGSRAATAGAGVPPGVLMEGGSAGGSSSAGGVCPALGPSPAPPLFVGSNFTATGLAGSIAGAAGGLGVAPRNFAMPGGGLLAQTNKNCGDGTVVPSRGGFLEDVEAAATAGGLFGPPSKPVTMGRPHTGLFSSGLSEDDDPSLLFPVVPPSPSGVAVGDAAEPAGGSSAAAHGGDGRGGRQEVFTGSKGLDPLGHYNPDEGVCFDMDNVRLAATERRAAHEDHAKPATAATAAATPGKIPVLSLSEMAGAAAGLGANGGVAATGSAGSAAAGASAAAPSAGGPSGATSGATTAAAPQLFSLNAGLFGSGGQQIGSSLIEATFDYGAIERLKQAGGGSPGGSAGSANPGKYPEAGPNGARGVAAATGQSVVGAQPVGGGEVAGAASMSARAAAQPGGLLLTPPQSGMLGSAGKGVFGLGGGSSGEMVYGSGSGSDAGGSAAAGAAAAAAATGAANAGALQQGHLAPPRSFGASQGGANSSGELSTVTRQSYPVGFAASFRDLGGGGRESGGREANSSSSLNLAAGGVPAGGGGGSAPGGATAAEQPQLFSLPQPGQKGSTSGGVATSAAAAAPASLPFSTGLGGSPDSSRNPGGIPLSLEPRGAPVINSSGSAAAGGSGSGADAGGPEDGATSARNNEVGAEPVFVLAPPESLVVAAQSLAPAPVGVGSAGTLQAGSAGSGASGSSAIHPQPFSTTPIGSKVLSGGITALALKKVPSSLTSGTAVPGELTLGASKPPSVDAGPTHGFGSGGVAASSSSSVGQLSVSDATRPPGVEMPPEQQPVFLISGAAMGAAGVPEIRNAGAPAAAAAAAASGIVALGGASNLSPLAPGAAGGGVAPLRASNVFGPQQSCDAAPGASSAAAQDTDGGAAGSVHVGTEGPQESGGRAEDDDQLFALPAADPGLGRRESSQQMKRKLKGAYYMGGMSHNAYSAGLSGMGDLGPMPTLGAGTRIIADVCDESSCAS